MRSLYRSILLLIFISGSLLFGQTWNSYTTATGLADNQVRCITSDSTGTVWIGTKTKGIIGFDGANFIAFPKNTSLPNVSGVYTEITALKYIAGRLFIGVASAATLNGLWIYDFQLNTLKYVGTFELIGSNDIYAFYQAANGTIYGGSSSGFFKRVEDNNWQRIGYGFVRSIAAKSDGTIYYTTFDSLYKYDGVTKLGVKSGMFYSVVFDANNVGYTSTLSDIFKFEGTTFTALGFSGYAKSMIMDKMGKVWIAGSGSPGFGLKSISGNTITTYVSGGSPLLSNDMTCIWVGQDNRKYIGHYNAGLNTIADQPIVVPVTISPLTATVPKGGTKLFTAANGTMPYRWAISPSSLGTIDTSGATALFHAAQTGTGYIIVKSVSGSDSARASLTVVDTQSIVKLPPSGLVVSKGKYAGRIDVSWVPPGEFSQGFEDGIPASWKVNPPAGEQTLWAVSEFQPYSGSKCVKFDVYSPSQPMTDWLITEKIHVSQEKPNFTFYIRTAYAFGNSYSSYVKLSTASQDPSSFTVTLREFEPAFLADSNLRWRPVSINLSSYINQDVYLAFQCQAKDIIIYLDDLAMTGQSGLTGTGRAVRSYRLYRSLSPQNVQNQANLINDALVTNFNDQSITPLKNYFYAISAVYDSLFETAATPPGRGIAYAQSDSLVLPSASNTAPVVDGTINAGEYSDAFKTILTRGGYWADAYLKTSGGKFYLAVDYFADSSLAANDFMLFAFDKNRNFAFDTLYEGVYRIMKTDTGLELAYFPYTVLGFNNGIINPPGFNGAVSVANGHVQYEISLDLNSSYLNLPPDRRIGAYIAAFNEKNSLSSAWLERCIAGEYSVGAFGSITFPPSGVVCKDVVLASGWNLISVPVTASDMNTTTLFPAASSPAYAYNNGYQTAALLQNQKGYWLRYPQAAVVSVCGTPTNAQIPLSAGWNLIGVNGTDLSTAAITTTPAGIINTPFYSYNNGYSTTTTLNIGKGYWVRASQAGVINTAAEASNAAGKNESFAKLNTALKLTLTDARGSSMPLYFTDNSDALEAYALPPLPPDGIFDVRFATQRSAEFIGGPVKEIVISGAEYPVRISSAGVAGTLRDKLTHGKIFSRAIALNEQIVINDPTIASFEFITSDIPVDFALQQNFPNPFNPSTAIRFALPYKSDVSVKIFNQIGQQITELVKGTFEPGYHEVIWNAANQPSGVYFCKMITPKFNSVKKLVLVK